MIGTRLGPYEITAKLGEGGMGEVYRATDTKLKRQVAIKVLPAAFTEDKERLARFEREAQLLAQLHHPHIASIFGLEEADGVRALVMELVEGDDLSALVSRGPLPLAEALAIARQIAEALEAAHERGIVHRDLKPQNIKVSGEGTVKVLDFGLAKAMDPAAGSTSASDLARSPTLMNSPTLTGMHGTQLGVILGSAAYMAPEQAKGMAVDKRADIWAFGVVLYEMLSGRRLFDGDSVPETLAGVLKTEIDFAALPAGTPPAIRRLLRSCLERNPKNRLHDIADARLVLTEAQTPGAGEVEASAAPASRRRGLALWLPWALAAIFATVAVFVLVSAQRSGSQARLEPVARTSILAPPSLLRAPEPGAFALAPDASAIVFVAPDEAGKSRLWVRELADPSPRPLAGTEGAGLFPFWSPDARAIAYFAEGALHRVPRAGGASQRICDADNGRGGAWGQDGTILFAPDPYSPLLRVPASGGAPAPATTLDPATKETSHRFPSFLPDGRHFVFAADSGQARGGYRIEIASLDRLATTRVLLESNSAARFAAPRHLVFARERALLAQEIDLDRLELVGEPQLLAEQPEFSAPVYGTPVAEFSRDGEMLYAPRDNRPTEFVWMDRAGRIGESITRQEGSFWYPTVARGGDRLAAMRIEPNSSNSLWVFDLARGGGTRLAALNRTHYGTAWSGDDRELATLVTSEAETSLVWVDTESGRERKLLATGTRWMVPYSVSADGRLLLVGELTGERRLDLLFVGLEGEPVLASYLETAADEGLATLSPDGRWVAYLSDASGSPELYVDRFPEPAGARRVVTEHVALAVWWPAGAGSELFLMVREQGKTVIYSCRVQTNPSLEIETPQRLFELPDGFRDFAPIPDGQRFVLLRPVGERAAALTLVQNWAAALEPAQ